MTVRYKLSMYKCVLFRYFGAEKRGKNQKKGRGKRPSLFDMNYDPDDYIEVEIVQEKATPVQNVYFFKKGTSDKDDVLFILFLKEKSTFRTTI